MQVLGGIDHRHLEIVQIGIVHLPHLPQFFHGDEPTGSQGRIVYRRDSRFIDELAIHVYAAGDTTFSGSMVRASRMTKWGGQ